VQNNEQSQAIGVWKEGAGDNRLPAWKLFGQIWKYSGKPENEDQFFIFQRSN